jgi:ribonucleoside-diphosphate reductase alpha chain
LRNQYERLWDIKDNEGYLQLCAIMQKFVDQSISSNTHYDPSQYDGNKVPMKLFLMDMLKAYKYGLKTLYYHTTRDGATDDLAGKKDDNACADGVCKL